MPLYSYDREKGNACGQSRRKFVDSLGIRRAFIATRLYVVTRVSGLGEDIEDTAIVRTVIELAHTFGMEAVAEGVETEGQAELLREMGCDMAQGYHFARPMPPEWIPATLSAGPQSG